MKTITTYTERRTITTNDEGRTTAARKAAKEQQEGASQCTQ